MAHLVRMKLSNVSLMSIHPIKYSSRILVVSTAFQVLSDSDKRAHYDRYGKSPDDRSMPSGGGSPSFRRQGGFAGGGGMGDEMSPEDLFNMFFG